MSETYDSLAYYRIKQLEETNERLKSQLMETNDTLEKANIDRNDLLRKLDTECKKKQDLQEQLDNIGKTYCETARRVGELVREKEELQRQIDVLKQRGIGELWAMIREVNSAPIEALYGSGAFNNKICVGTIVNMYSDVRDFIKEYEAWKKKEEKTVEEVPCSFAWKLDGTEFTIESSIPREAYDNIVKIISGKE